VKPQSWPETAEELLAIQSELARATPAPWDIEREPLVGASFVCSVRGKRGAGQAGDPAWAAAALSDERIALAEGRAGAPYEPGLLALREGPVLESAVRALPEPPAVLIVAATGRDHPRRAGLALHLGAVLGLPSLGVTHRPLLACGEWPADTPGARMPLVLEGEIVGCWLRTRPGTRPLAVHAGWRVDVETATEIVLAHSRWRTPEPLRLARRAARSARARAEVASEP
jgi:deoxyribonuclease V